MKKKKNNICRMSVPGKIILTGEHAVLYGGPALIVTINLFCNVLICSEPEKIKLEFLDINYFNTCTFYELQKIQIKLKNLQSDFFKKKTNISLQDFEIIQYSIYRILKKLKFNFTSGLKIMIKSDIPIGCGMGSSAASIIGVNYAIMKYFQNYIDDISQFLLALEIENIQHGKSSGIDLYTIINGGCYWFSNYINKKYKLIIDKLLIINTGKPISITRDCVLSCKKFFLSDKNLIKKFSVIAKTIKNSLLSYDKSSLICSVKYNHRLLVSIGVVPHKIQNLINHIEEAGGAAKICGAGSISGEKGGIIWIVGEKKILTPVVRNQGYKIKEIHITYEGVYY